MTKKSIKSRSAVQKTRNNSSSRVSFNSYSFDLGNVKVLTNYLNQDTKDLIIKLYRSKKFNQKLYEEKPQEKDQKLIVLTELEAVEAIKDVSLRQKRESLQNLRDKFETYLEKTSWVVSDDVEEKCKNNPYLKHKRFLHETIHNEIKLIKQRAQQRQQKKQAKKRVLRELIERTVLKIQLQIFTLSILMIIQANLSSIVIFEQAYLPKRFQKQQLIHLIGHEAYEKKLISTLKIYDYSIKEESFYNPAFVSCHDCMKVISSKNYPQHDLNCLKTIDQKEDPNIKSVFAFTPTSYYHKIIKRQYFTQEKLDEEPFTHPYIQYHLKTGNNNKLSCGRHWCGECIIKYKHGMSFDHCQFCDRICYCFRCNRFQRIVESLAHYIDMEGKLNDLKERFLFYRVFCTNEFQRGTSMNQTLTTRSSSQGFAFKKQLQEMYELYVKKQSRDKTEQWQKVSNSDILSGVQHENIKYSYNNILDHQDKQRMKKKSRVDDILNMEKRNFIKQIEIKRERNLDIRISNMAEETKDKFQDAQKELFDVLKKKLIKAKVLKLADSSTNSRSAHNLKDVVIVQESEMNKNKSKFFEQVKIEEANPFKRNQQQRELIRNSSFQVQKLQREDIEKQKMQQMVDKSNNSIPSLFDNTNKNDNNYGSIWQ